MAGMGALMTYRFAWAEWRNSAKAVGHINDAKCLELVGTRRPDWDQKREPPRCPETCSGMKRDTSPRKPRIALADCDGTAQARYEAHGL